MTDVRSRIGLEPRFGNSENLAMNLLLVRLSETLINTTLCAVSTGFKQ